MTDENLTDDELLEIAKREREKAAELEAHAHEIRQYVSNRR